MLQLKSVAQLTDPLPWFSVHVWEREREWEGAILWKEKVFLKQSLFSKLLSIFFLKAAATWKSNIFLGSKTDWLVPRRAFVDRREGLQVWMLTFPLLYIPSHKVPHSLSPSLQILHSVFTVPIEILESWSWIGEKQRNEKREEDNTEKQLQLHCLQLTDWLELFATWKERERETWELGRGGGGCGKSSYLKNVCFLPSSFIKQIMGSPPPHLPFYPWFFCRKKSKKYFTRILSGTIFFFCSRFWWCYFRFGCYWSTWVVAFFARGNFFCKKSNFGHKVSNPWICPVFSGLKHWDKFIFLFYKLYPYHPIPPLCLEKIWHVGIWKSSKL